VTLPSPPARPPGPVKIQVPDSYLHGTRDEVWEELERYIFTGFLTAPTHVAGRTFVFKTVNQLEVRNLELMRPLRTSPVEVTAAFKAAFISHSILMVDGENVLWERPRHIRRLTSIVAKLHPAAQDEILVNLRALNMRAVRLHPLVEAYVHENRSRYRWNQLSSINVHSPASTGIPGTEDVGMNWCQLTWTALNRILDRREEMEWNWMHAKFTGSCFNPKGVKSVDERDRGRRERERTEVEDLKMRVLHDYLNRRVGPGGKRQERLTQLPDGRMAVVEGNHRRDSVQDLAEQLQNHLNGVRDHHDMVVMEWERKKEERKADFETERRGIRSGIPSSDVARLPGAVGDSSRIIGSKSDADALISKGRERTMRAILRSQAVEDLQSSDKGPGEEGED